MKIKKLMKRVANSLGFKPRGKSVIDKWKLVTDGKEKNKTESAGESPNINVDEIEIHAGVHTATLPNGEIVKILISHSRDLNMQGAPEGWYFSLETEPSMAIGPFPDSNKAMFEGALKRITYEMVIPQYQEQEQHQSKTVH